MINTHAGAVLCARCVWAAGCTIPVEPDEPVLSCERFESLDHYPEALDRKAKSNGRIEGLCGDCANRMSCVFRRREGGIWHCEEYR